MRTQLSFLALLLFIVSQAIGDDKSSGAMLGLVKEKPADGRFVKTERGYMVPYTATILGTDVEYEMVPIPGGKFLMGSPTKEQNRKDDEGPQFEVTVKPFWMGKYEITWSEYKQFMALHDIFKAFQAHKIRPVTDDNVADAITAPSNLYEPTFTFQSGEHPRQPAITMTQFAAKQYTKWLSQLTENKYFFRLPSEAEWEYACRAGSTTAYYFGDEVAKLDDYAWHIDNSDDRTRRVGQKKPNAWGLYDMHGNAAEWVLDEYDESGYARHKGKSLNAAEAIRWPTKVFPRVVRGGSWELEVEECRSAARLGSDDDEWKTEDPNFPQSPWWFTSYPATGVGFRIIRPLNSPKTNAEREKYWKADVDLIWTDVKHRIENEGRGAFGMVDKELPKAIEELKAKLKKK